MEMSADWLAWALSQFDLTMLFFALFFILLHLVVRKKSVPFAEVIFRWIVLFSLGFTGIYTFVMHAFFRIMSAAAIGWETSPFQFEVAMADLSLGVLGILSFRATYGFRLATVIASLCMLWGDALGHVKQMVINNNFTPGNAGTWFWLDIFVPLLLLLCILNLKKSK